jgi:bifunctional DNA primase/polymerase-like protein/AAA domain-containing protein
VDPKTIRATVAQAIEYELSCWPPRQDGTKAPEGSWGTFTKRRPTRAELTEVYASPRCGVGLICGEVSRGLECLDIEDRETWNTFVGAMADAGITDLGREVARGYMEYAPSGGVHWLWHTDAPQGNTKLARHADGRVRIETRGEGGYVIVAPSFGPIHPTGNSWTLAHGGIPTITTLSAGDRDALLTVCRNLDEGPRVTPVPDAERTPYEDKGRPGDVFNQRGDWASDVLEPAGWTKVGQMGEQEYWRRPGKDRGHSAVLHIDTGVLVSFSTSTPLEAEKGYTKFTALATLAYDGSHSSCASGLKARGFFVEEAQDPGDYTWQASWGWIRGAPARPTMLRRSDGEHLIYPGQAHSLVAPSEHLKSWMALHLAAEQVKLGERVVYLDAEMDGYRIGDRLRSMGLGEDLLSRIHYHRVEDRAPAGDVEALVALEPAVVIIDGLNELLSLYNWDYGNTNEVLRLFKAVTRPFNRAGIATVTLDHPGHLVSDRAAGSQAKKSGIDVVYVLREVTRGSPACRAVSAIQVAKDRDGWVRSKAIDGTHAGKIVVDPGPDGSVTTSIQSSFAGEFVIASGPAQKECEECGAPFEATTKRARFCGGPCRSKFGRRQVNESDAE